MHARRLIFILLLMLHAASWAQTPPPADVAAAKPLNLSLPREAGSYRTFGTPARPGPQSGQGNVPSVDAALPYGSGYEARRGPGSGRGIGQGEGRWATGAAARARGGGMGAGGGMGKGRGRR